jgi:hypothetical protein
MTLLKHVSDGWTVAGCENIRLPQLGARLDELSGESLLSEGVLRLASLLQVSRYVLSLCCMLSCICFRVNPIGSKLSSCNDFHHLRLGGC